MADVPLLAEPLPTAGLPRHRAVVAVDIEHSTSRPDPVKAELVQLRYFAGLPIREVAEMLGIAPRTADRLWAFARAWLHQEIEGR